VAPEVAELLPAAVNMNDTSPCAPYVRNTMKSHINIYVGG